MAYTPDQDKQAHKAHREWLGMIRPVGLTVSIPALLKAQVLLDSNTLPLRRRYLELLPESTTPLLPQLQTLLTDFLDWPSNRLITNPDELPSARLEFCSETLRPTAAARLKADPNSPWLLLIQELPATTDLDTELPQAPNQWAATPQARFERLLKQTGIPTGLLYNQHQLRLVYAPAGESPGHLAFDAKALASTDGRPLLAALHLLLSQSRLFTAGKADNLNAILLDSRRYQNEVSTQLAGQVLEALYILLAGFEQANKNPASRGFLDATLARDPQHVYAGLLTVLLRLVFLLYAEDKGLLPTHPTFQNYYALNALFEQLRADEALYKDTMSQRYGAWARLLSLFRLLHSGSDYAPFDIPAREGYLLDPQRYPFLEGRKSASDPLPDHLPAVPDSTILHLLERLLLLGGERLSYRALDVEQIGSVYEVIMGFSLEIAAGYSIALKPKKKLGAPITIDLEALLATKQQERNKWLLQQSGKKLSGRSSRLLSEANSLEEIIAALEGILARNITPVPVPKGSMIFQSSLARRQSGSNYTPRSLTEPIVRHTLAPILDDLGLHPKPDQILALKVCDPAMGSGAFLVEVCRQLGAALEQAWQYHQTELFIPPDEDIVLYAQRRVAQRCLYGVDKNPMATDLAKLSLWLATLAKDHPFTFLDHNLRSGDSLVGFTVAQIARFNWTVEKQEDAFGKYFEGRINQALQARLEILNADELSGYETKSQKLRVALDLLQDARLAGNALVASFFNFENKTVREKDRQAVMQHVAALFDPHSTDPASADILTATTQKYMLNPFHWDLEFPEVFQPSFSKSPGFDCIVGNPPFAGKNTITAANPKNYISWLKALHPESHGNADLVAHFFLRAFNLLRDQGALGLIATNTIGQGDTRSTGLRFLCTHGGEIFRAVKRLPWPGDAAVVVSVVHVIKGAWDRPRTLDNREVSRITAYLFHEGSSEDPAVLEANANKSFIGSYILGMGFTFDDTDKKGIASKLSVMHDLIAKDPRNAERIFPYLGGEEINDEPDHRHHRYVINFEDFPLRRNETGGSWFDLTKAAQRAQLSEGNVAPDYPGAVAMDWPDLLAIVEERVKGKRAEHSTAAWWHYERYRGELYEAIRGLDRVLCVNCAATPHVAIAQIPRGLVYASTLAVSPFDSHHPFAILQSRVHEVWARFMASSMKDDLRYTPSDCFETFPFPRNADLEAIGREYYEFRAQMMINHDQGMTKTYNRFHNPCDKTPAIGDLRRLHSLMDRAVLDAYGWQDIPSDCTFQLEFSDDESSEEDSADTSILEGEFDCKKKYRLRWPEPIRDLVLARLLNLNLQRAEEEAAERAAKSPPPIKPKQKKIATNQPLLENL